MNFIALYLPNIKTTVFNNCKELKDNMNYFIQYQKSLCKDCINQNIIYGINDYNLIYSLNNKNII